MGTVIRATLLFTAMAALMTATQVATAPAQTKDKDKKEVKANTDEAGYTEVYMAKDGWRFKVKSAEGKPIAVGTISFDKKEDCLKAVEAVKTALSKGKLVEIKDEKK